MADTAWIAWLVQLGGRKNTCIPPGFPQKQRKKKKEEDVLIVRGEKLICTNDEKRSTHTDVKS